MFYPCCLLISDRVCDILFCFLKAFWKFLYEQDSNFTTLYTFFQEKPTLAAFLEVTDNNVSNPDNKAYEADAESMIQKLQLNSEDTKADKKVKPKVDPQCMAAGTG